MDHKTFDAYLEEKFDTIRMTLGLKGMEYVPDEGGSRFHNFDIAAAFNDESPEKALWGMLTKHLVSIADMVKVDPTKHAMEVWDEKIGDALNYLLLLNGMVKDHHATAELVRFHTGLINAMTPPDTNVTSAVIQSNNHLSGLASGGIESVRKDDTHDSACCSQQP